MNTRLLFVISLCVAILSVWFYRSQDKLESESFFAETNIDYQATNIDALHTNSTGHVEYLLSADEVTHYSDSNKDELKNLFVDWQPSRERRVQINAAHGVLNNNTGEVTMTQDVMFVSFPMASNGNLGISSDENTSLPMQLSAQKLNGNIKTNSVYSDDPIVVTHGNSSFESSSFTGDLNTGEYEFNQIAVTFVPPERQNVPLF